MRTPVSREQRREHIHSLMLIMRKIERIYLVRYDYLQAYAQHVNLR